eukprot:TRINITY_DN5252_c0_g1_i1.p1 TRINITY_DN5252_c0_g1~~TRINITY_DN5252_c0_g1_i1.p1  ORF type:complete len:446 (+),score=95.05 TRINITY_DN5252_c0_g1_i1:93-1430(+)
MAPGKKEKPFVSRKDVAKHNKESDLWIIVEDKVYDLTKWGKYHPGGILPLIALAGNDATEPFRNYHEKWVYTEKLVNFHVATLTEESLPVREEVVAFRELTKELEEKGLFETNYWWYGRLVLWLTVLFWSATLPVILFPDSWTSTIFSGLALAFFWQQAAFIGHDWCHNAFTHDRNFDTILVSIAAFTMGISPQWWKHTHNVHHVVTNSKEFDPDIQHLPFLAISEKMFNTFFSKHHGREFKFDAFAKFLVSIQHYLYYPVMGFARVNLYAQSFVLHFKSKSKVPYKVLDLGALVLFWCWYIVLVAQMPTWQQRVTYIFLSHFFSGLLHVQITISHMPLPLNEDFDDEHSPYNFLKTQFEHSLDVDCEPWMDWFYGGLQYQVVHHLWPRIPRHNLRYVRDKYFLPYAEKHGFKYQIEDFITCNKMVIETLRKAAMKARSFEISTY